MSPLNKASSLGRSSERAPLPLAPRRSNRHSLQAYQSEVAKLADQVYRDAEEKALLKEALERTRLQLSKEKRLSKALKKPKVVGAARDWRRRQ